MFYTPVPINLQYSWTVFLFLSITTIALASTENLADKLMAPPPMFDGNAVSINTAGTNPGNLSITVPTGMDRLLVATIGTDDMTGVATVQFNGQGMTLAGEDTDIISTNSTAYNARTLVYYMVLGSGAAITNAISVSGLSSYYSLGGMSFQDIDQTAPVKQVAMAGTPTGTDVTSQVAATLNGVTGGNLLFGFFGDDNAKQFDWGGPYHSATQTNTGLNGDGYYYASYNANAGAGTQTLTYNINNAIQSCAGVLIEFAAVSAVVPAVVNLSLLPASITEISSASLDYLFTISAVFPTDLTINFQLSGTAEDDDDFTVSTPGTNNETINYTTKVGTGNNMGTITIKAGQLQGLLQIKPQQDAIIELDETVTVTIM